MVDGEHADGRTKPGQLYVEVSGKKYILIGNESQLRAIGSNKSVTPRLYVYYKPGLVSVWLVAILFTVLIIREMRTLAWML